MQPVSQARRRQGDENRNHPFHSVNPQDGQESSGPSPGSRVHKHLKLEPKRAVNPTAVVNLRRESPSGEEQPRLEGEHPPQIEYRYLLHAPGFGVNGCLPSDAPAYRMIDEMESQPTQPIARQDEDNANAPMLLAHQLQDEADVLCTLLPVSQGALKAVDIISATAPQHILQNYALEGIPEAHYENSGTATRAASFRNQSADLSESKRSTGTNPQNEMTPNPKDIALRMSSKIRDPSMGFVFGRNPKHCDIIITDDEMLGVSKHQFRIFLKPHGVLMLEDMSTNGTFVDNSHLRCSGPGPKSRTITGGTLITTPLTNENFIRFSVKMPTRHHAQKEYEQNLAAYLQYIQQATRQAQVAKAAHGKLPLPPPMPFTPLNRDTDEPSPGASLIGAATGEYNHGMHWNGGEKYNVVKYIGKGAFAMVFKVSTKGDGDVYAAKEIEKRRFIKDGQMGSKVHHEISIMERLRHPNIVQFVEYEETSSHIYIIMEYVEFGDLTMYTARRTMMNEYMARVMASQICDALKYLHEQRITHRDVKPDNILVASHQPFIFKLSDFGLSKIVKDEETFLKTFCGTILYCAPEIYPGFQRMRIGKQPKRDRHWDQTPNQTMPYKHSVDTWGIAAVLFHLLAAQPAWTGTTENQGAVMLENIMRTPVNWEHLATAGVSGTCIDFLRRMLIIEPEQRLTEDEQLQHPWIAQILKGEDGDRMETDGARSGETDLDASQLSLTDRTPPRGKESTSGNMEDPRQSKRMRAEEPDRTLESMFGDFDDSVPSWGPGHPAWSMIQRQNQQAQRPAGKDRLFGEISTSALQSSTALDQNANAALDIPTAQVPVGYSNISSIDPNHPGPSIDRGNTVFQQAAPHVNPKQARKPLKHLAETPGSSLLGAEALVGQLNMASPTRGTSDPSTEAISPSEVNEEPASPEPSTRRRSSRQLRSRKQTRTDSEGTSEVSPQPSDTRKGKKELSQPRATRKTQQESYNDAQRVSGLTRNNSSFLPTAINSQDSQNMERANIDIRGVEEQQQQQPSASASNSTTSIPTDAITAALSPQPNNAQFHSNLQHPANNTSPKNTSSFCFGKLIPVLGSIATCPVIIRNQTNSFGRDPSSTFVHPDPLYVRISKNAMDITMEYPGLDHDLERGSTDWHLRDDLSAYISTRASTYIKINGVRLMRGKGCWLYGKLHTGDVVSIFEAAEGRKPRSEAENQFLKFRCEFYVGASKAPRGKDNPFVVLKDEEQFRRNELMRSRGQSEGGRSGSVNGRWSMS